MSSLAEAAFLGVVQGLTEFLPVSSSAHLILARAFFGFDGDRFGLSFDVACHVGTLIAVLIYFRCEVEQMIRSLPRLFDPGAARNAGPRDPGTGWGSGADEKNQGARLVWLLVVGTIPAVVVGLLFNAQIEEHMRVPQVAALALAL